MIYLLTIVHVAASLVLVLVVLLQTGKRADLAGAFGGGGSQTAFGARGTATVLSKLTTTCAVIFMVTSLGLAILSTRATGRSESVLDEAPPPVSGPAEAGEPGDATTPAATPDTPPAETPQEVPADPDNPAPQDDTGN